jgi:hypothetical protein
MRDKETLKSKKAGMTAVAVLLVVVVIAAVLIGIAFILQADHVTDVPPPTKGVTTTQSPGEIRITITDPGNLDSLQLVGPNGTRSIVLSSGFQPGAKITVRSNATVYSYLENDSVKIPADGGGFMTVAMPNDVTTTQLSLQEANLTDTDYTPRAAYLACLYEPEGLVLDGESVPSNASVPCHSPVLTQNSSFQPGTTIEQDGDTVTTPILLKEDEHYLVGTVDGSENVVQSVETDEETFGKQAE